MSSTLFCITFRCICGEAAPNAALCATTVPHLLHKKWGYGIRAAWKRDWNRKMSVKAPGSGQNYLSLALKWKQMCPHSSAESAHTAKCISFQPHHFEVTGTSEYWLTNELPLDLSIIAPASTVIWTLRESEDLNKRHSSHSESDKQRASKVMTHSAHLLSHGTPEQGEN